MLSNRHPFAPKCPGCGKEMNMYHCDEGYLFMCSCWWASPPRLTPEAAFEAANTLHKHKEALLTLNEYQEAAARTINPSLSLEKAHMHALHEIAAEVGEIHSIYQKELQGHPYDVRHLMREIGDLLWGIAELCTTKGITLGEVATMNIEKLKQRYPDGFTAERSLHREGTED